jgi:hypothetical protein
MAEDFVMTIDYDSVRNTFLNDFKIYAGAIERQMKRESRIDADDVHSLLAALNVAISCINSREALRAVCDIVNDVTGNVANANRSRQETEWENDDDDTTN